MMLILHNVIEGFQTPSSACITQRRQQDKTKKKLKEKFVEAEQQMFK